MHDTHLYKIRKGFNKYLGNQLREERKKNYLSIKQVSRKIGVHPNTLYNYEKGDREIKAYDLYLIAEYYGIPPGLFFPLSTIDDDEKELLKSLRQMEKQERTETISILIGILDFIKRKRKAERRTPA